MAQDIRSLVIGRFAEAHGVAPEALDLDAPLEGEDWEDDLVEEICREVGVPPGEVFQWTPLPTRSEMAVLGLRMLAPLSGRAAERLREMELRWEVPTVESLIRSLQARHPVPSGHWQATRDEPIPPGRSVARFAAWTGGTAVPLTLAVWGGCDPACRACPTLTGTAWGPGLAVPLALVGGVHVLVLLAGLRELQRGPAVAAAAPP